MHRWLHTQAVIFRLGEFAEKIFGHLIAVLINNLAHHIPVCTAVKIYACTTFHCRSLLCAYGNNSCNRRCMYPIRS